jgi:hypothetical protein
MQHAADITRIPQRPPYAEMWKTVQTDWKTIHKNCTLLARVTGLEPATSGVTGRRSNQLSYTRSGRGEGLGRCIDHVKREETDRRAFSPKATDQSGPAATWHRIGVPWEPGGR